MGLKLGLVELNWSFVFQIVNTIILFFILKKLLFKPVSEFMEKRRAEIEGSINEAQAKNEEAEKYKAEYIKKLEASEEEGRQIVKEAAKRAEERANEIIKAAHKEAEEIKQRANLEIERERKKAINALKDDIASIAMLAASKVIEEGIDENKHNTLVRKFIDEVGEARWQN
ncbi:F0F1 ATP synthase subunit B [Paramaledivibacter caminithermalis]|jgi:F-type H+-transporting ATPase subunit b|uniref:ATP synthase subunit b n=1 Tax=Paramaledivibacter caminithermalis (strain DSM 15212 / CIP 107654 / DViRD3) TaxID=1121301 RepID=A0A1M6L362_PARC5|nr:F0F1 ATP synthase subunit B [Paramaledivibacter caminithermalis]SHJ65661.1 F-type H+-transporting ATPase subunit b [Paramaledivibacter caminithermalis DSM 15212]